MNLTLSLLDKEAGATWEDNSLKQDSSMYQLEMVFATFDVENSRSKI